MPTLITLGGASARGFGQTAGGGLPTFNAFPIPTNFTNPGNGFATLSFNSSVAYGNGIYVVTGNSNSNFPLVSYSTDGITFTTPYDFFGGTLGSVQTVNYCNNIFIVAIYRSNVPYFSTSATGSSWSSTSQVGGTTNQATVPNNICYGNGKYVMLANYNSYIYYSTSTDAVNWTTFASSGIYLGLYNGSLIYAQNRFLAIGSPGSYITSTDGVSWTLGTFGTGGFYSVAHGAGQFVAVGSYSSLPIYSTSNDGINWSGATTIGSTPMNVHGIAYGNGLFVVVGFDSSSNPLWMTSSNGTTWSGPITLSSSGNRLFGVVYNKDTGRFLAEGSYSSTSYHTLSN